MSEIEKQESRLGLALIAITLASLSFAVMSVLTKYALVSTPVPIIAFFRFLILLLCMLPILLSHGIRIFKTDNIWLHILRGTVGALALSLTFISIRYIPLSTVVLLSSTEPMFIPFIFRVFRGTKIIWKLYIGICIGLIGIALILRPQHGYFEFAAFLALGAGLCRAITISTLRVLTKSNPNKTIMFYFFFIGTIVTGLSTTFTSWHGMEHWAWGWIIGIGLASFFFQLFFTIAFRHAPARILSPFNYLAVVFVAIADWILWSQGMSWLTVLGITLAIGGAILTTIFGRKII